MKKYSVNTTPLYLTVRNLLLEAIRTEEIGDDGRLPSEGMLCKQFGVSRATIRSALQALENEGVITKRHGSTTVVNTGGLQVKMRIDEFKGFFQLIQESGHRPSIAHKELIRIPHSPQIANLLGLEKDEEFYQLERLFLGDGKPVILASEFIPKSKLIKELTFEEIPESIFELADLYCTNTIAQTITEIRSTIATRDLKERMGLANNETMLKLEEIHYGRQGEPLIFSDILVRDKIIHFHAVRKRY
ncbi:GntR family transcriptional regulator [Neobacillus massiliamazoniensis]|uniref:GntR family transcriptional regulator n=1 Tax=Neobacillus massiliamazoniensis TaxID=1499688 RepID=A0A0U1NYF2_9BACI|nr:GntR family transcriptional regulator [Neobacillus massiliamazoniensis]CRK83055.1 GntR family transcriptional regulator [Neobacillus massiliamazoniensis]